MMDEFIAA
jgi:hypothetical protein